jgi:hypothetical protein
VTEHADYGKHRHVAYPCDEEDEQGRPVRTWDIFRHGRCVAGGFTTRAQARGRALELDKLEAQG